MLELSDPHVAVTGFDRKNLYFEVRHDKDKYRSIRDYLLAHPDSAEAKAGAYVGLVGENIHI